jgi:hypothetical protein
VRRIEVLAFREPEDYLPRAAWYGQFLDRELGDGLALKRDIRGVAGATLTARATTDAVRRVLALHRVIAAASAGADGHREDDAGGAAAETPAVEAAANAPAARAAAAGGGVAAAGSVEAAGPEAPR